MAGRLRCFVYGQGRCYPGDPFYSHFAKRETILGFLQSLGVNAEMPEDLDLLAEPGEGWLDAQLRYAQQCDLIVALQPPNPASGPPTLRTELAMAVSDPSTRTRLVVLGPSDDSTPWFDALVNNLNEAQVFLYSDEVYDECVDIRRYLQELVRLMGGID